MSTCDHNGCKKTAKFTVHFALRVDEHHPPAMSTPIIRVCGDHMDVQWKDVYTDKGWEQICRAFTAAGKMAPKVRFSYLEIKPIGDDKDKREHTTQTS